MPTKKYFIIALKVIAIIGITVLSYLFAYNLGLQLDTDFAIMSKESAADFIGTIFSLGCSIICFFALFLMNNKDKK